MSMELCRLWVRWVLAVAQAAFWSFCTLIGSSTTIRPKVSDGVLRPLTHCPHSFIKCNNLSCCATSNFKYADRKTTFV